MRDPTTLADEPLWYKDAIFYEVRVRSFFDSSGDGIGDFPGLTAKLDYLKSLGVTTLWLLPFYPSPQLDDGYDISDYTDVHPDCGSLRDFKLFLREAHRRGLRIVTELVINHTSDHHPWFERARRAPKGDPARDFYVWSDNPEQYSGARVIFQDFEPSNWTWDPLAHCYYWHRFYCHQPDLNFDNPAVRKAVIGVLDFWFGLGVDGLRLDAVPYLFEREGTNCENLPETHAFLRELRSHVDRKFRNRMLLAEANQWPEDAVAYLEGGKECHMAFHFPLMPRLFIAVRMEDRFPVTDVWAQTPAIDETCQWALFLRNHDELTLEMVTDEERDYMYRAYARETRMRINLGIRRRLAPLMGNNRRSIELVHGLLFSLPGTPVIYYGDEIGMGDNIYLGDRDGVRTPMQWSGDRNAGFSRGDPQRLILPVVIDYEYHYQTVNVEAQERNRHSLLWWIRRLVALRKQFKAFGRGTIEFLNPENPRVLAFIRSYEDERVLVVANLSRFVQYVELDLSRFKGMTPIELFGHTPFPAVGALPYLLTLGPHMFAWFSLEAPGGQKAAVAAQQEPPSPIIETGRSWDNFVGGENHEQLERILPDYLPRCRWFRSKAAIIRGAKIVDTVAMTDQHEGPHLTLIEVDLASGDSETYLLPMAISQGADAEQIRNTAPAAVIANLHFNGRAGNRERLLFDATADAGFARHLLEVMSRRRTLPGRQGELAGRSAAGYAQFRDGADSLEPRLLRVEQTNSSVAFGDKLIFKLYRRLETGISPDLEISRYLTEAVAFPNSPALAGWLEYRSGRNEPRTIGLLQGFVANQGDAWSFSQHELKRYFERAATRNTLAEVPDRSVTDLLDVENPDEGASYMIGAYIEAARLMGRRTAELHLALVSRPDDPAFAPEPFLPLWQRSVYQSLRNLAGQVLRLLGARQAFLPEQLRDQAARLLSNAGKINGRFDAFLKQRISIVRLRTHGDFHLGQILCTGTDFVIIDFEGEPARSLAERRRKRAAIRDVAGMLRSFHYAAFGTLQEVIRTGTLAGCDFASLSQWASMWQLWSSWAFLKEYLSMAGNAPFVPKSRTELKVLLDAFVLEKAIYELGYELNNRPTWVGIPMHGIEQVLGTGKGASSEGV